MAGDPRALGRSIPIAITALLASGMQGKAKPRVGTKFQRGDPTQKSCIQFLRLIGASVEKFCSAVGPPAASGTLWPVDPFFFIAKCIMGRLDLKINEYVLFLCILQTTQMQPYVSVITFHGVWGVGKIDVFPLGMFLLVVHISCWQTQFV